MFLMFLFLLPLKNVFSIIVFSLLLIKSNEIIPRLIFVLPFSLKLLLIKLNSGSLTCDNFEIIKNYQ